MTTCSSIISTICETLAKNTNLSDVKFMCEFPGIKQDLPLYQPTVSVGIDGLTVELAEDSVRLSEGCAPCTVSVNLRICVPKRNSGMGCYNVLDRIITACGSVITSFKVIGMTTEEIRYSSSLDALVLSLGIVINNGNAF